MVVVDDGCGIGPESELLELMEIFACEHHGPMRSSVHVLVLCPDILLANRTPDHHETYEVQLLTICAVRTESVLYQSKTKGEERVTSLETSFWNIEIQQETGRNPFFLYWWLD
jgi:hypothetical protein